MVGKSSKDSKGSEMIYMMDDGMMGELPSIDEFGDMGTQQKLDLAKILGEGIGMNDDIDYTQILRDEQAMSKILKKKLAEEMMMSDSETTLDPDNLRVIDDLDSEVKILQEKFLKDQEKIVSKSHRAPIMIDNEKSLEELFKEIMKKCAADNIETMREEKHEGKRLSEIIPPAAD